MTAKCYACGGVVDADGMAQGGEVDVDTDGSGEFELPSVNGGGESTQNVQADDAEEKARRSFVRAIKARGMRT